MSILHVVAGLDPARGDIRDAVLSLVETMRRAGQSSEIVCLEAPGSPVLQGIDVPVAAVGPALGPWSYSPKLRPWLRSNFLRFEAIVVHGLWLFHSYSVWKLFSGTQQQSSAMQRTIPWFVMPHGMLSIGPQEDRASYGNLGATRNAAFWRAAERSVVNEADGLLFATAEEMRRARETFPCYAPRSERVVGIDGRWTLGPDRLQMK